MPYSDWFRRVASGRETGRPRARKSTLITAISAAVVVIAGVAVLLIVPGKTTLRTTSVAASRQDGRRPAPAHPAPALQVTSVTPGSNSRNVNGTSPIEVGFSAPLAADSALPKLSPSVAGSWKVDGSTATFTPAAGFPEDTTVSLTIPAGSSGMRSAAGAKAGAGGYLASGFTRSFTTASYSTLRLEQLLAQLGYLPLTWTAERDPGAALRLGRPAGRRVYPAGRQLQLAGRVPLRAATACGRRAPATPSSPARSGPSSRKRA